MFKHSESLSEKQKQTCLSESHKTLEMAKESYTNQYPPSTLISKVHRSENQKSYYELKVSTHLKKLYITVLCISGSNPTLKYFQMALQFVL